MTSIDAKIKAQEEAKQAIRNAQYNGAVIMSVGTGKAKILIDIAMELIKKYDIKNVLYLCDNRRLRDSDQEGFPEQLNKWGNDRLRSITRLECYQTAYKWKNQEWDLLLSDESDFAITTEYCKVFFNNKFKFKIFATGTLTADKRKTLVEIVPIVYSLSTVQAEQRNILNKTNYYIYNFYMSDDESEEYKKITKQIIRKFATEQRDETRKYFLGKRKELLFTLDSSYEHCRIIMNWLWNRNKDTRLIIFCERTSQADRVCKYSYHGGNEKLDNLKKFQEGEISGISVVGKIKRGINVKNTDTAIFKELSSSTTEFEQRNGRMKRLPTSEIATVIFMCPWFKKEKMDGSVEWKPTIVYDWIYKATSNIKGIQIKTLKI